jgi:uracil-DNA glycosylase
MALVAERINSEDVSSLIGWWRDAGVDADVGEDAVDWLAVKTAAPLLDPERLEPDRIDKEPLPKSLAELTTWLMTSINIPDAGPLARRVAPSGDAAAGFMILIDMPEATDADAGTLLSGEIAELVDKMLVAIGRDRSTVYIASVSPGRTPTGRLAESTLGRLSEIARHHVALAAPEKLWLMGDAASRAILGVSQMAARGSLHVVNQHGGKRVAIASAHPRLLLQTPKRKAEVWADMQRLMKGIEV